MITISIATAIGTGLFLLCAGIWIGIAGVLMGAVIEREKPASNVVYLASRRQRRMR